MDESTKKELIAKGISEIQCYPLEQKEVSVDGYSSLPISEMAMFGAAISSIIPPLRTVSQTVTTNGGETLYRMFIPNGLSVGEKLVEAKTGGLLGNVSGLDGKITQRARYFAVNGQTTSMTTTMPIDPATMMMAIALASINKKLDAIQEAQKEILEYLKLKEKAKLRGNEAVLQEILKDYRFNWDNDKYKTNKHIQVQEIKRDSEQSIIFSREQISKKVDKKSLLHSDWDVKTKIQKLQGEFNDYELALYLFSFASFLEIMLLENFDEGYLNSVTEKIESYRNQYNELFKSCYDKIESDSKSSIQSHVLKGVAGLNKAMGNAIAKIPKISEGQVDENLIAAGGKVDDFNTKRTEKTMNMFAKEEIICVLPFVENIKAINTIYNGQMDILFDGDNLYYKLGG